MAKRMADSRMARFAVFWFNVFALVVFTHPVSASSTTIPSTSATTAYSPRVQSSSFITPTASLVVQTSTLAFTSSISTTEMPVGKTFNVQIRVNETFLPGYTDLSSSESLTFIRNFTTKMEDVFSSLSYLKQVEVKNLSHGSVLVDFNVVVYSLSNASTNAIERALENANRTGSLGYQLVGNIAVQEVQQSSSSIVPTSTAKITKTGASATTYSPSGASATTYSPSGASATTYSPSVPSSSATLTPQPTTATKPTNMWDKAIDLATPLGTFIIVIVAVAVVLILLIALICVCCKYRRLKKRTHLFDHMTINESEWIRSNDDLLMWERNLRASEVKTNNGVSNRPLNEKRS